MDSPTQQTYRHRILKVQLHIQEHLEDDLSVEQLASLAHFSPFHFHRIFRGIVGETLHEYLRRLRLERAACDLKNSQRSVTAIAFRAGYESHEAFTRAFRQLFGTAPSNFRSESRVVFEEMTMSTMTERAVRFEHVPTRRVAFLRHVGPYNEVGTTFQKICGYAGRKGLFGPNTVVLGVCHDDPDITEPSKIRYDACVTVHDQFIPDGDVGVQVLEGGDCAILTHRGSYEGLGDSYRWLYGTWLPSSGREARDQPPYEVYLSDPDQTPVDQLVTEIHLPLRPM